MDPKATARQWANQRRTESERDHAQDEAEREHRRYLISIYSEQRSAEMDLTSDIGLTQIEVDRETVNAETLERLGREYGISQASSSHLGKSTDPLWFYSTTPREDRAYFEHGTETYYSLHLHAVDELPPEASDYRQAAELMGVRLETSHELNRIEREIAEHGHEF